MQHASERVRRRIANPSLVRSRLQGPRYVIVICARQVGDTSWGVDNRALRLGAELSRLIYEHFRARHPPV